MIFGKRDENVHRQTVPHPFNAYLSLCVFLSGVIFGLQSRTIKPNIKDPMVPCGGGHPSFFEAGFVSMGFNGWFTNGSLRFCLEIGL